jgi:hypothetical protein
MPGTPKILLSDCFLLFPKVQKSEMKSTRSKSVAKSIGKNFNGIKRNVSRFHFFFFGISHCETREQLPKAVFRKVFSN